jgi:hypothetical protein
MSNYVHTNESWEPFIIELGEKRLEDFGLAAQDWTIKFIDEDEELDEGSAGYCWKRGRLIFLTREYLLNTDERNVEETILHEIAHALTSGEHDQVHIDMLRKIGGTGLWYGADGITTTVYPVKY